MNKDIEVLSAISGDQISRKRIHRRFRGYSESVASELFSDSKLRQLNSHAEYKASDYFSDNVFKEDAVRQAMDKLEDWIIDKNHMSVANPYAYAKRVISNALVDIARKRYSIRKKLNEDQGIITRGKDKRIDAGGLVPGETSNAYEEKRNRQALKDMAWIDDGFGKIVENDDNGDYSGSGWRLFIPSEDPQCDFELDKSSIFPIIIHPTINVCTEKLEEVLKHEWWNGFESDDINHAFTEHTNKLWGKYNLVSALIDSIPSTNERTVLLHRLWGFKPVRIAEKLKVSEPYISKVLKKWMMDWGWNGDDIAQAQLILLSRQLAAWHDGNLTVDERREVDKREYRSGRDSENYYQTLAELRNRILALDREGEYNDKSLFFTNRSIEARKQRYIESLKASEGIGTSPKTEKQVAEYELWKLEESSKKDLMGKIHKNEEEEIQKYKILITSPQTSVYFHDLDLSDINSRYWHKDHETGNLSHISLSYRIRNIACLFYGCWYPVTSRKSRFS